jgi:cell division protein FtsL
MTYISQYYYNWKQAEKAKKQVLEMSGLDINLTGKILFDILLRRIIILIVGLLGKRTRYQVNNTSQLLVDITRKESQETVANKTEEENLILPKVKIDWIKKNNNKIKFCFDLKESYIK